MELKSLWIENRNKYHISLIAGSKGLDRQIDWVHIIEDLDVADFLHGNELVFTTGIVKKEEFLIHLAERIYEKDACGLVLNLGPYIAEIPQELIDFGEEKEFPIFTVPWDVRLVDVTRTFSTTLNEYEETEKKLREAIENAIFHSDVPELYLSYMKRFDYNNIENYQFAVIDTLLPLPDHITEERLVRLIRQHLTNLPKRAVVFLQERKILIFFSEENIPFCRSSMESLLKLCNDRKIHLHCGIGPVVTSLKCLPRSYEHAVRSLELSHKKGISLLDYEELGVYKIIMDVQDHKMLERYYQKELGPLIEQDAKKQTGYMEILREYLETNGSIQEMAEKHFCHRNTITYKIQKIKAILDINLDDAIKKQELLLAFQILDCM